MKISIQNGISKFKWVCSKHTHFRLVYTNYSPLAALKASANALGTTTSSLFTCAIAADSSASFFARTDKLTTRDLRSTPVYFASIESPTEITEVMSSTRSAVASFARINASTPPSIQL